MDASPGSRPDARDRDRPAHAVGGSADEQVEHVDEYGDVVAIVTRARMRAENLRHRSVAIIVQSSDGRLLVHRRADDKDLFPGWWDLAAGGVVAAGEASDDAAVRELAEELGIAGVAPEFLAECSHDDEHAKERSRVYRVLHDGPYRFDDGEVTEAHLVDADQLALLLTTESFLPGSVAMLLPIIARCDGFGGSGTPGGPEGLGGLVPDVDRVRCQPVQRVEFTIEPFVEGQPGRHVTAPVEAVQAHGIDVEFGPFGSECTATPADTPAVVAAIVQAAFANGATHVTIDVTAIDDTVAVEGTDR